MPQSNIVILHAVKSGQTQEWPDSAAGRSAPLATQFDSIASLHDVSKTMHALHGRLSNPENVFPGPDTTTTSVVLGSSCNLYLSTVASDAEAPAVAGSAAADSLAGWGVSC